MDPTKLRMIEKVKALLARGDSFHEEEARTSLFLAHQLMKKHGITYRDLGSVGAGFSLTEYMRGLGRMGGKKSAEGRRRKLSPERRAEIARKAAQARWARR